MKIAFALVLLVVLCTIPPRAQQPIPPGVREADTIENRYPLEPPMEQVSRRVTPAQLASESAKLGQLTSLVQQEVALVNKGQLPRDLPKNLKEIEKLAHRLRSQLTP